MFRFVTAHGLAGFVVGASLPWIAGHVLNRHPAGGVSGEWMVITCVIIGVFAASVAFGAASLARRISPARSHARAFLLMVFAFFAAAFELQRLTGGKEFLAVVVVTSCLSVATSMLAAGLAERDSKPA